MAIDKAEERAVSRQECMIVALQTVQPSCLPSVISQGSKIVCANNIIAIHNVNDKRLKEKKKPKKRGGPPTGALTKVVRRLSLWDSHQDLTSCLSVLALRFQFPESKTIIKKVRNIRWCYLY